MESSSLVLVARILSEYSYRGTLQPERVAAFRCCRNEHIGPSGQSAAPTLTKVSSWKALFRMAMNRSPYLADTECRFAYWVWELFKFELTV
jgi:hypothetical protein